MISGLVQILLWQGLGELISYFLIPILPGPVLGLIFLLMFLIIKGQVNPSLATVSDAFSQHLGVLFIPATVGVILFLPQLKAHAFAVIIALIMSVVLTIVTTAVILRLLARKNSNES
ncbi:CidA/LrgA family protein [Nitrosomonas sp. Is37]|uniref:CidA/LrgA family protein n=1 Tax=Nitrosomonas sp. Is37 TaxID=3080535 RepID=UPI00294B3737|nr:CidA/LrgA family protein [Nitrosomonas sp. Is37]MDV6344921.1 CidA/LrgA family protein [Nitrosomonas sp. Is37]